MLMMSCASSQTISIRSLLHITSPLWNAMGNSWGNCPSNINHQVEQSVFLSPFFLSTGFFPLLVSMVTATLKDTLQEISPKEKQRMKAGGEGGQRMVRKRQEGCMGVQYFLLRGQPPVSFSAARVLIHRSQGANTNLYSVCVIVFSLFLNTSFSCVVSWWSEISVSRDPYVKGNVVFTDTEAFQLSLSSLYDKLRAEITVGSESMAGC